MFTLYGLVKEASEDGIESTSCGWFLFFFMHVYILKDSLLIKKKWPSIWRGLIDKVLIKYCGCSESVIEISDGKLTFLKFFDEILYLHQISSKVHLKMDDIFP